MKSSTDNKYFLSLTHYIPLLIASVIISGCQSSTAIKNETIIRAKKEFAFTKRNILKHFKKGNIKKLYKNPTIFDYYNIAMWNNKEIDIQISKLLKTYSAINTVYYEEPQLGIIFAPIYEIFKSGGPFTREFMLSQMFPLGSKLSLERKSIQEELKAEYYNTINTILEIQNEITTNLVRWKKINIIKYIKKKKLTFLKKIKQYLVSSINISKDNMIFQELIQTNLKISQLKKEIFYLDSNISNIKNNIATLLYMQDYKKLKLPDLTSIEKMGNKNTLKTFSHSPALRKYKALINKSKIAIDRATKNFIPNIALSLGYTFKSMDPVNDFMGKRGILSSLMLNLPIYREKLKATLMSSIYENLVAKYEYTNFERKLLQNFMSNEIEINIYNTILSTIKKEIWEVKKLTNYLIALNKINDTTYIQNTEIDMVLLDYKELYKDIKYEKIIKGLENRFVVGKFILGANR